jgi:hypothetical protein
MHNPTVFRAQFSGLILKVFGRLQTLEWKPEVEMYQARDSPELWAARMAATGAPLKFQAATIADLAYVIEESFVERLTDWIPAVSTGPSQQRPRPENVIVMPLKRRA